MQSIARIMIAGGLLILVAGVILLFFPRASSWLGRLPGDITVTKENFVFRFPIVTCIIVSILLSLLIRALQWFTRH